LQHIDAIILAGGLGTRLQRVLPGLPKPLAPINGTPFLDLLLTQVQSIPAIRSVVLAIGYQFEKMIARYKTYPVRFSIEKTPLGTGGAIKHALQETDAKELLIVNGDTYVDFSFDALLDMHQNSNSAFTIVSQETEEASRFGSMIIDAKTNRVLSFREKSKEIQKGYISCGVYLIKREAFDSLALSENFSLEYDALPLLLQEGVYASVSKGTFIDIGTEESYSQAQEILKPLCQKIHTF